MKKLILLFSFLAFAACKTETKKEGPSEAQLQMKEVIEVHDELMPRMSEIGSLSGKLKERLDAEETIDSAKVASMEELKEAHNAMMDWMKDFGNDFTFEEINKGKELSEAKKEKLDGYQKSVHELEDQMNLAIENAESLLQQ